MAGILSKMGNNYNVPLREYTLTDLADIADLPTTTSDAKGKFFTTSTSWFYLSGYYSNGA